MRTIAIDDPERLSVCKSLSLSQGFTRLRCANTAKQIQALLGIENLKNTRNIVFDGSLEIPYAFGASFAKLLWPLVSLDKRLMRSDVIHHV